MNYATKRTLKKTISIVLAVLLMAGAVFALYSLFDDKKTKEVSPIVFSRGALDANGKYKESKASIYTKEAIECQGLKITPKFNNTISYEVFFYDEDGVFVSNTGRLTTVCKDSVPAIAKYCRIVITPIEDEKVSLTEVLKYARQLTSCKRKR